LPSRAPVGKNEVVVEAEVERITYEGANGFRVVKLAVSGRPERVTAVGVFPPVAVGARVRARGKMENDRRHGEQLRVEGITELAPNTLVGIERYLGSGMIKGVGEKYAKRIVARFGLDTLRVLDEEPERLHEVEGLGEKRVLGITRAWSEQKAVRDVMVFLQSHGASPTLATRILKRYGARASHVVANEPYRLALEVWGVGFKTADRLAGAIGIARDSPERLQAGALQALHDVTESGSVYATEEELFARAARVLELDAPSEQTRAQVASAASALVLSSRVMVEEAGGERVYSTPELYAAEVRVARRFHELVRAPLRPLPGAEAAIADFESSARVELAEAQRRSVLEAARSQVVIITGGPGVGKTTVVRAVLSVLARAGLDVRLAAPTGRAAKRMTEATGREATTLHRLLEFDPKRAVFRRDRGHPIQAEAIIVDEASMIDLPMADALFQATAPGTRLVLVGDVDQLPSVGPGAVLRDLIASAQAPCVRLTHIFRQAAESLIVANAHRINSGLAPVAPAPGTPEADFFVVERTDPESAKSTILELVTQRIPNRFGLDPVKDVQVLTPMHRGPAGSVALNVALQQSLNPDAPSLTRGTRLFRTGDKVMQLRNDYEKGVYNGDLGIVTSIDPEEESLTVRYEEREVEYDPSSLDELVLAYACSVHKSQGSEYPAVVISLLTSHFVMLSRNLLYTAVTRGKRLVVLVCDPRAVKLALSERRKDERRTRLAERLVLAAEAS
jgi:exodeoxyribonuclease V alpha subunit